jgi:uncharacterized protein YgiM (DUF1202 family)
MNRRILFTSLTLALAGFACLTPAAVPTLPLPGATENAGQAGVSSVATTGIQAVVATNLVTPEAHQVTQDLTAESQLIAKCAIVTVPEAVHLRTASTEHSPAIDWLTTGEDVRIHLREGDWYFVTFENHTGYIKSEFLEEIPCK